ncbi:MAG TPA: phage antirepressor N-terminal domain-containing protein [Ktedonobacterales bacterium]|nr:phage antirepressor N-terminal domain-containing protein [Ktedonobacterales bacterium]
MNQQVIVPVKQAEITLAGLRFLAVLLPDGQHGLVLSVLCSALGLRTYKQAERLRAHRVLATALVLVKIETAGGPQTVNVLLSWGIPLWIASIKPGWRSPEYQERLLIIQQNVGAALARMFFQPPAAAEPAPSPMPEAVEALPPGPDPLLEHYRREVEQYRQELNATRRLLAAAIERVLQHEGRLEHLESLYRKWQRAKQPERPRKHKR